VAETEVEYDELTGIIEELRRGGALDRGSNECDVLLVIGYYFLNIICWIMVFCDNLTTPIALLVNSYHELSMTPPEKR